MARIGSWKDEGAGRRIGNAGTQIPTQEAIRNKGWAYHSNARSEVRRHSIANGSADAPNAARRYADRCDYPEV